MAPKNKGENAKKVAGNAKKAEAAAKKAAAAQAQKEAEEASEWAKGAKSLEKKEAEARKREEAAAKKAEKERLLREEEAALPSKGGKGAKQATKRPGLDLNQLDALEASGVDGALEALALTGGGPVVTIDRHPERRKAAAWEAYKARRLPEIRQDPQYKGLRLQQMVEQLRKEFEKSPENPMNQVGVVKHNASQAEIEEVRKLAKERLEAQYAKKNKK